MQRVQRVRARRRDWNQLVRVLGQHQTISTVMKGAQREGPPSGMHRSSTQQLCCHEPLPQLKPAMKTPIMTPMSLATTTTAREGRKKKKKKKKTTTKKKTEKKLKQSTSAKLTCVLLQRFSE